MNEGKRERIAPSFKDSADLVKAWDDNRAETGEGTYARAGYRELRERESEIAEMVGVPDTALFNAGMAAIATIIEAEHLHPGDVVLCGKDMYGKTRNLVDSLAERGVRVVPVSSGDMQEITRAIDVEKPRLIIIEAVSNSEKMEVCDVAKLAELAEQTNKRYHSEYSAEALLKKYLASREYSKDITPEKQGDILERIAEFKEGSNPMVLRDVVRTIEDALHCAREDAIQEAARLTKYILKSERESLVVVLDNTLSSPILRNPLLEVGGRDTPVIVVESGTKHFQMGRDQITLGIAYSNDEQKLKRIKQKRAEMGTYLQPQDEAVLTEHLVAHIPQVIELQSSHALALAALLESLPGVSEVNHPNLPSHRDNELAHALAPEGLVTLFYIKVEDPLGFVDGVKKIAGDDIEIGTSFGHTKTRLLPMPWKGEVRIAAGAEDADAFERIVNSFKAASAKKL